MNKSLEDVQLWSEFKKYFRAFVVDDVCKSMQAGLEVGTIILTTVGIECLGGYYAGEPAGRAHFVRFLSDFMPNYSAYAEDLYACVRNGLAHDYVVKRNPQTQRTFLFKRDHGEAHLVPSLTDPNAVYISRATFAQDFLAAQEAYFLKAESDQQVWDRAVQRLRGDRGFLTIRSENELLSPQGGSSGAGILSGVQAASAMGTATGTSAPPNVSSGSPASTGFSTPS